MNITLFPGERALPFFYKRNLFLFAIILIPILLFLLNYLGFSNSKFGLLIIIPLFFIFSLSFETTLFVFISSIFLNYVFLNIYVSVICSFLLFFSYFLVKDEKFQIAAFQLKIPFMVYLFTIIPSLINTVDLPKTLLYMQNLIAIYLLTIMLFNYITNFAKIKKILLLIGAFCFVNSLYAIVFGIISGRRSWGFAGLGHVDFFSLSSFIFAILVIFTKGYKRLISLSFFLIFFIAVVVTQTRSMFIALGISFLSLMVYLFVKNVKYNFKRSKIVLVLVSSVAIVSLILFLLLQVSPNSFSRFEQLDSIESEKIEHEVDFASNSIFSRLVIWHTAYKCFTAHPIIGIGAYSFPFSSQFYHELSPYIYKELVEGLTPHLTYIAVLAETGIIGFLGFLFLLGSLLKFGFKTLEMAKSREEMLYSLILVFSQVYVIISMCLTDAWLWGQCGMLWGIIMGCIAGTNKLLKSREKVQ